MAISTIEIALASYPAPQGGTGGRGIPDPSKSFLLQDPFFELMATYADGHTQSDSRSTLMPLPCVLSFESNDLRSIELRISFHLTVRGHRHRVFHVVQFIKPQSSGGMPSGTPSALQPAGWKKDETPISSLRTDGRLNQPLEHPLLKLSKDCQQVTVNVCFVDISDLWFDLWKDVDTYRRWKTFFAGNPVELRFLATTLGEPLIWACAVPASVASSAYITPLIFYMPADFGDIDLPSPSIDAITAQAHMRSPLMQYILAPPGDHLLDNNDKKQLGEQFRNVVHHDASGPKHWNIDFGLARAVGACKRPYVLLIPQRKAGGGNGLATSSLVRFMSYAAIDLMRSQDIKFVPRNSTPPQPTKMVLCGYSDSGVSLWSSAWTNMDHINSIIAIEPQNLNALTNQDISGIKKRGIDVLARFVTLDKGKTELAKHKFCLIGRHRTYYRPQLSAVGLSEENVKGTLELFPKAELYDSIFVYPPTDDNGLHPFVRYRTYRLYHPDEDPLMNATEKAHIDALLARSPGTAAPRALFPDLFNQDRGSGNWYSHNFAANGGQEFTLPVKDPVRSYYGVLVNYKTFFQECLEIVRP